MRKGTSLSNLKRIAQILYRERESMPIKNNTMESSGIDSFLMFVSHEINDCSVYPYWANLDFEDLDDFLYMLLRWNDGFKYISPADNDFIKKYIENNRSHIWEYFSNKPSFGIVIISHNFKNIVLMETLGKIISCLDESVLKSKSWERGFTDLIHLMLCKEFVIYFNKVWNDVSYAIKNKIVREEIAFTPKWCINEELFTEDNRGKILGTWRGIKMGVINLPSNGD